MNKTKNKKSIDIDDALISLLWFSAIWLSVGRILSGVAGWILALFLVPGTIAAVIYCSVMTSNYNKLKRKKLKRRLYRTTLFLISISLMVMSFSLIEAADEGGSYSILTVYSKGLVSTDVSIGIFIATTLTFVTLNWLYIVVSSVALSKK